MSSITMDSRHASQVDVMRSVHVCPMAAGRAHAMLWPLNASVTWSSHSARGRVGRLHAAAFASYDRAVPRRHAPLAVARHAARAHSATRSVRMGVREHCCVVPPQLVNGIKRRTVNVTWTATSRARDWMTHRRRRRTRSCCTVSETCSGEGERDSTLLLGPRSAVLRTRSQCSAAGDRAKDETAKVDLYTARCACAVCEKHCAAKYAIRLGREPRAPLRAASLK